MITGLSELATPTGTPPLTGAGQGAVETIPDAAIAFRDGRIQAVGTTHELSSWTAEDTLDGTGCTLIPGLVDAHTHPVFAGERSHELTMKLQGASYSEILEAGGGILSTVEATRSADRAVLIDQTGGRLDRCLAAGTTTMEAKTGYALSVEGELALLEALVALDASHPMDLVNTVLGAHALPPGADRTEFLQQVCAELTPRAAKQGGARFCDAFVDEGAFTVEEGRGVLEAGREAGLGVRIHADELARTGAFELGLELEAASIDHVNQITSEDTATLATAVDDGWSGLVTLCPVTPFTSELPYAPARDLIEVGVPVALGSDLNPNAWSEGMWLTLSLAVHGMRMTPAEALVAATVNSAWSLGLEDRGRLEEGLIGDAVLLDVPSHKHIGYRLPSPPVRAVVKGGEVRPASTRTR